MNHILKKFQTSLPSTFSPANNQTILALLTALAESDEFLEQQAKNAKDQIFVRTAEGRGLDVLGNAVGVSRPPTLGMLDEDFQRLIPLLSLTPKQIKKAFYDVADVFFGELFTRANISTANAETFNLNIGDEFSVIVDGGEVQTIDIRVGDVVTPGLATAEEVVVWMNKHLSGLTASALQDPGTGLSRLNVRTNTPGSVGSLEILSASSIGVGRLEFDLGDVDILDLGQRFVVYNVDPNVLTIEIPAAVPTLRRTLRGSHHFHLDATLETPIPPQNGIWAGSFLHDPSGSQGGFVITGQSAVLQSTILAGSTQTTIIVDDTSSFENNSGNLVFNFGRTEQEQPVQFLNILNANTIAVDPSYVFNQTHLSGRMINVLSVLEAISPRRNGQDLSIYLPSPVEARVIVQTILERLKAAGIVLDFQVSLPRYTYRCDSPYTKADDSPSGN